MLKSRIVLVVDIIYSSVTIDLLIISIAEMDTCRYFFAKVHPPESSKIYLIWYQMASQEVL